MTFRSPSSDSESQAEAFLQKMGTQVDLDALRKSRGRTGSANGSAARAVDPKPLYNPAIYRLQDSHHSLLKDL
jgi:hypothetical protein